MNWFQRRYVRPAEAAQALECDQETVRQWVLYWDGEPERIALYAEIPSAFRVLWAPEPDPDHPRRYEKRDAQRVGRASLVDITEWTPPDDAEPWQIPHFEKGGEIVSKELALGPSVWLELDPMIAHEVAARPDAQHNISYFRAGEDTHHSIPRRSIISSVVPEALVLSFHQCWISAKDLEKIRSEIMAGNASPATGNELQPREKNNLLRIIRALDAIAQLPERGAASSIQKQLELLGFDAPSETTIRNVIAEARKLTAGS